MRGRDPLAQILFASPAIKNLDVFGRLFGLTDVVEFFSVEPTVAQNFLITTIESATKGKLSIHTAGDGSKALREVAKLQLNCTLASCTEKLIHIPRELGRGPLEHHLRQRRCRGRKRCVATCRADVGS